MSECMHSLDASCRNCGRSASNILGNRDAEIASLKEQLRLSIIDAANNESEANDLRDEVERLKGKLSERAMITETIPRNLSEENSALRSEYEKLGEKYTTLRTRAEQAEARVEKVRDLIEESEEVPHLEITSGNVAKMLKEILK